MQQNPIEFNIKNKKNRIKLEQFADINQILQWFPHQISDYKSKFKNTTPNHAESFHSISYYTTILLELRGFLHWYNLFDWIDREQYTALILEQLTMNN